MTDIVIPTQSHHKIRARIIVCENAGLTLAEKSVRFHIAAHPSNADGTVIGPQPVCEITPSYSVPALLADPELAADAAMALAALERIGSIMCQRHAAELAAKLNVEG